MQNPITWSTGYIYLEPRYFEMALFKHIEKNVCFSTRFENLLANSHTSTRNNIFLRQLWLEWSMLTNEIGHITFGLAYC